MTNIQKPSSSIQGQKPPEDHGKSDIDPEKFKKAMKIDKSDETGKKEGKKKTKQEENEEEEMQLKSKNPSHARFSQFLDETEVKGTIFSTREGKNHLKESELPETAKSSDKNLSQPFKAKTKITSKIKQDQPPKELQELQSDHPNNQLIKAATRERTEIIKKPANKLMVVENNKQPTYDEKIVESIETNQPTHDEKTTEASTSNYEELKINKKNEEKLEPLVTSQIQQNFTPTPQLAQLAEISPLEATPYTTLSPEIFEIFEKMVGIMTIEQYKGISTTTINLNIPNSPFDKCQIVIEHYSTAPHEFNLQLKGDIQAIERMNANISSLVAAFQGASLSFKVNIKTPILSDEPRHLIKRKEKSGGEHQEK